MITVELLEVLYDADRQRDELVFAQLFARHIASHEDQRAHAVEAEERAQDERSVSQGRDGW